MSYRIYDHASTDAQTALTEFLTEFETALVAMPQPWARTYGATRMSRALSTKWPIPLSAAGYQELNNDPRYRTLAHKSIELIKKTWQDGVAEELGVVEAPDFFGWGQEPENMASALAALPNERIAAALTAGTTDTSPLTGEVFFSNSHPYNVFDTGLGTFDNHHTSQTVSAANLAAAKVRFRQIKAANGKSLGLRLTHILSPANLEEQWRDVLERDVILEEAPTNDASSSVTNRHKGTVSLIVADELADDIWYPMALNKPAVRPWAIIEGDRKDMILGTDSALYEREGKIGFDSRAELVGGLLMPHAIQRCAV